MIKNWFIYILFQMILAVLIIYGIPSIVLVYFEYSIPIYTLVLPFFWVSSLVEKEILYFRDNNIGLFRKNKKPS
jgi:hypothetical protein